jgi:hypothetical protein
MSSCIVQLEAILEGDIVRGRVSEIVGPPLGYMRE